MFLRWCMFLKFANVGGAINCAPLSWLFIWERRSARKRHSHRHIDTMLRSRSAVEVFFCAEDTELLSVRHKNIPSTRTRYRITYFFLWRFYFGYTELKNCVSCTPTSLLLDVFRSHNEMLFRSRVSFLDSCAQCPRFIFSSMELFFIAFSYKYGTDHYLLFMWRIWLQILC